MKIAQNFKVSVLFILCFSFSFCGNAAPSFYPLSFQLTAELMSSPDQVSQFLQQEFRIMDDESLFGVSDYWQSPIEFWESRAGDCEDYALMANYLLRSFGYKSYVVSLYAKGYAHTVTLFKHRGKWYGVNMGKLSGKPSKSLREALSRVNPEWKWAALAKAENHRGKMIKKFRR